jgi:hypothetical protein
VSEVWAWVKAWWSDHHCVICGKFNRRDDGYHWECMRPLMDDLL